VGNFYFSENYKEFLSHEIYETTPNPIVRE